MHAEPSFLQGVFSFRGSGLDQPAPLGDGGLTFTVPAGRYAQPTYLRAGNSADALVSLVLLRDGVPMRFFPVGAKDACHVTLAVVEDVLPGTRLDVHLAAPEGVSGTVVVDMGVVLTNHEY